MTTDLDALIAFDLRLARSWECDTEADVLDCLAAEARETGGVFDLGMSRIHVELHGVTGDGTTTAELVADWRRAATLRMAEMTVREAKDPRTMLHAARTIRRLSEVPSWLVTADEIIARYERDAA